MSYIGKGNNKKIVSTTIGSSKCRGTCKGIRKNPRQVSPELWLGNTDVDLLCHLSRLKDKVFSTKVVVSTVMSGSLFTRFPIVDYVNTAVAFFL